MKRFILAAAGMLCSIPLAVHSGEVITGAKFNAFTASPNDYLEMSVILEDTFEGVVQTFNRTETQNYYTPDMYVKFKLGRCPYPCVGMKTGLLERGLNQCAPGDLIRVHGSLAQIYQSRTMATVQGQYSGGPSYDERINVYGPLASEFLFVVGQIEKGWGKQDTADEMLSEGKHLPAENYRDVPLAELNLEPGSFVEKCIFFQGGFGGISSSFTDLEKAAGLTPDKVIKFTVQDEAMSNYVPRSDANVEGFKNIPQGNKIQVYGRIRVKDTPQGVLAGVMVDRVTKTVTIKPAAPAAAPQDSGPAGQYPLVPPPPAR